MRRALANTSKNSSHSLQIQGLPAYEATGFLDAHSVLLPMRKVLVRTSRGIVEIDYFELKDNRENFVASSKWIHEKTFDQMLSSLKFNY